MLAHTPGQNPTRARKSSDYSDRLLANVAKQAKAVLQTETLDAVADRGYFNSPEILACHEPDTPSILDQRLPDLRSQAPLHDRAAAPDHPLGARARARSRSEEAR
jgi:hypothetical protein